MYQKIFVLLVCVLGSALTSSSVGPRKRSLFFPNPSTLLLIFGLGTPLQLERESVILGSFTKFIYNLPTNSSQFSHANDQIDNRRSDKIGVSRWSLYRRLGRLADIYELGGRTCVLRAVCEVAAGPFDPDHGLLSHLLLLFFSPSSTQFEPYEDTTDRDYEEAERFGAERSSPDVCGNRFGADCPVSLLDAFSNDESIADNEEADDGDDDDVAD